MSEPGDYAPWRYNMDYYSEKDELSLADLDDGTLVYTTGSERMVVAG